LRPKNSENPASQRKVFGRNNWSAGRKANWVAKKGSHDVESFSTKSRLADTAKASRLTSCNWLLANHGMPLEHCGMI